jgi:hypothetical protein
MKQPKIESLIVMAMVFMSGTIFLSSPATSEASATTEEQEEPERASRANFYYS